MNETENQLNRKMKDISFLSFSAKFCFIYSYHFQEKLNLYDIGNKNIFLIKYKGFKINDYPLPSNFETLNFEEKMKVLEENKFFFEYKLDNKKIEIICLINKFRASNNMNKLFYNKTENLNDFFKEKNTNNNKKYLFNNPFGEFKNKLLKNDKNISKILLNDELNYIMIFEREKSEYIFIYSNNNEKSITKANIEYDKKIFQIYKFHLFNNTIPIVSVKMSSRYIKNNFRKLLSIIFKDDGYQILSLKNDILIGVLEGPPNTSFENGYFLFKILFPIDYFFKPPQFIFITRIFHPNISENGYVSTDVLSYDGWTPALCSFSSIIYSIQSLLDDPNSDDFLNETAAKLYKEDRKNYDKTVREYTSVFANYSKFLEDVKNLNLKIETVKEGEEFKYTEEKD